jgi:hypothetical protein
MRIVQVLAAILLVLLAGMAIERTRIRGHQQPLASIQNSANR